MQTAMHGAFRMCRTDFTHLPQEVESESPNFDQGRPMMALSKTE